MLRGILPALALAGLTALTLPASGNAQVPQQERGRMGNQAGMGQPGEAPAARILELREQLGLTDAQVERIRGIQARLEEQNAPLLAQMTAAREQMRTERQQMTAEQRQAMRERMQAERQQMTPEQRAQMRQRPGAARAGAGMPEELQPMMEQLRTNNQSARDQIHAVLSAEQQEKLRAARPGTGQRQPGMRQGGAAGQRQPGMRQGPGGQRQPGMRQGGAAGQRQPGMRQPPRGGRGRVPGAAAGTR
jgi:hypothetical protein